jgi:glucose-6-phosphate 1-dehydrogenase
MSDSIDALVIFGATGDLAKLETFNGMDPDSPAATRMLGLLRYVDGDLDDEATYQAMSDQVGTGQRVLYYLEVPPVLGDAVPVHPHARGSWGPAEAVRLLPGRDTWYDPAS